MTTTLITQHMERLQHVEDLEAGVCKAGLAWAPSGEAATAAKGRMSNAEHHYSGALTEFNRLMHEATQLDPALGGELHRLHRSGALNRESIGSGGGSRINDILKAVEGLRKAGEAVETAKRESGVAHGKSAAGWGDVLRSYGSLRTASADVAIAVARVFGSDGAPSTAPPNANADAIAANCKARLQELGA